MSGAAVVLSVDRSGLNFRNLTPRIVWAVVAVGLGLRLLQYAANSSLWLDEIALAKGIVSASLVELLTQPLPYDQVAPKGFLLAQKLSLVALGPHDYAHRLVPFLFSVLALICFAKLATRALQGPGAVVATLLFATAAPLVSFSSMAKQYSADVFVAVTLLGLSLGLVEETTAEHKAWRAGFVGAAMLWFSQAGVLMAAALAFPLMWWMQSARPRDRLKPIAIVVGLWGTSAVAVTAVSLVSLSPVTHDYMQRYWEAGFPPPSLAQFWELRWPWPRIELLFTGGDGTQAGLSYPWSPLYPLLTAVGWGILVLRHPRLAAILITPIVLTLAAAVARRYPFTDRLILFLVPSVILGIGALADSMWFVARRSSVAAAVAAVAALSLPAVFPVASAPPPYQIEHVKPVLAHVMASRRPGDAAYVYFAGAPAMDFYAGQFGLPRTDYVVGGCHAGENRRYLEELDTFRGRRVWVIIVHSLRAFRDRDDILAYLDSIGDRKDQITIESYAVGRQPLPAEAFLYDLSGARDGDESASFPLLGPSSVDHRLGCTSGPQVMIPSDF